MAVISGGLRIKHLQFLEVLRNRDFRLYWLGLVASVTGMTCMQVGQFWLIYELTDSAAYLGILGVATAVPTFILNLVGGVVADRVNQRVMLVCTQSAAAVCTAVLGTLTLLGAVQVWHILTIAVVYGALSSFDGPTRMAMFPRLIDRSQMMNAVALNSTVWNGARIVGPAIGGALIAWLNIASAIYFATAGSLIMAIAMACVYLAPPQKRPKAPILHQLREGFAFIGSNRLFLSLMGMTFFNSVFGMSYIFLLPVFAKDILQIGPQGFGYLQTASGVGALLMSFASPILARVSWRGPLILGGAALFGLAIITFAYSVWFPLSLALMFIVGVMGALYQVLTMTSIQLLVPDNLRGRVMGVWGMTWSLMPVGGLQGGFLADWVGAPFALAVGGGAVAGFAAFLGVTSRAIRQLKGGAPTTTEASQTTSGGH
ncbi:MAG: MFS transporter [Dehalococcoidia bacterium]|nr:MFS transporter [Dehalococcoidia bacterium]